MRHILGAWTMWMMAGGVAPAAAEWDVPTNLGVDVNTAADEFGLCLSSDGSTLTFDSGRSGGAGGRDLYRATGSGATWGGVIPIPSVNTPGDEMSPSIALDGTRLVFTGDRLHLRTSASDGSGGWLPSSPVSTPVADGTPTWGGHVAGDGALYFSSWNRDGGLGGHDVWRAPAVDDGWGLPSLVAVNDARSAYTPFVQADSLVLAIDGDLYMSRLVDGAWSSPEDLGSVVNRAESREASPVLSPDGQYLYFSSNRPGGEGGYDLYVSRWVDGTVTVDETPSPGFSIRAEPNPMVNGAQVHVTIASAANVTMEVFDLGGRRVRGTRLTFPAAGERIWMWDGRDGSGARLAPGTYWLRASHPGGRETIRVQVLH